MKSIITQSCLLEIQPDNDATGNQTFGLAAGMDISSVSIGDGQFFTRTFYPENVDNDYTGYLGASDSFVFGNFPGFDNKAMGGSTAQLDWRGVALDFATIKGLVIDVRLKEENVLSFATGTLSDATGVNVTDADTVTIGSTVYRFKTTMAAPYDVKREATTAATMANLIDAINATGTAGVEYYDGTLAHPSVTASDATGAFPAILITAISQFSRVAASGTLTISGGVTDNDTVTIGATVYRFKSTLVAGAAYDVKIEATAAATIANLKAAINASGTAGTEYHSGTLVHPSAVGSTLTTTTLLIKAITSGTVGNSIATTIDEVGAVLDFTSTTLAGGAATASANTIATTEASTVLSFADVTITGGGEDPNTGALRDMDGSVQIIVENSLMPGASASMNYTVTSPSLLTLTVPDGWVPGATGKVTIVFESDGDPPLGPTDVNAVVTLTLIGSE